NASSRFYERSTEVLGMQPREWQTGGAGKEIRYSIEKTALGLVLIAATKQGICCVQFGTSTPELQTHLRNSFQNARILAGNSQFKRWAKIAVASINEAEGAKKLPLDLREIGRAHV